MTKLAQTAKARVESIKPDKASKVKPRFTARQRLALGIAGVATAMVILSVWHLTAAIACLTGSPILLALLMAVGIDLGLVGSEYADLRCHGEMAQKWARKYLVMASVLSMFLNSYEFFRHAPKNYLSQGLSIGLGIILPVLIYVLFRTSGYVWNKAYPKKAK